MRDPRGLLILLVLVGCGGGNAGTPDDPRFQGDYMVAWLVAGTGEPSARADLRRVRADGSGFFETDLEPDAHYDRVDSYTLSADGAINGLQGILCAEGPLYAEGDLDPEDETIGIGAGVRLDLQVAQAALFGDYVACGMSFRNADGQASTDLRSLSADGVMTLDWSVLTDSAGATGSGSQLYSIVDGYLVLESGELGGTQGDGNMFVVADQHGAAGVNSFRVAMRTSSEATNALFAGEYVCFGFVVSEDGSEVVTLRAVLEADGVGVTRTTVTRSDSSREFVVGTFAVAANGALSLEDGSSGIVRKDGGAVAWVDTDATDGWLSIWIGVRRS